MKYSEYIIYKQVNCFKHQQHYYVYHSKAVFPLRFIFVGVLFYDIVSCKSHLILGLDYVIQVFPVYLNITKVFALDSAVATVKKKVITIPKAPALIHMTWLTDVAMLPHVVYGFWYTDVHYFFFLFIFNHFQWIIFAHKSNLTSQRTVYALIHLQNIYRGIHYIYI